MYSLAYEVIFGKCLTPLTISIVVPIVVLCYVRHNTIAEGSSYNKGIANSHTLSSSW